MWVMILLGGGFLFIAGIAAGLRIQELSTQGRERRVAEQRRMLADRTGARWSQVVDQDDIVRDGQQTSRSA